MPATEILGVRGAPRPARQAPDPARPDQVERVFGLDLLGGGALFDVARTAAARASWSRRSRTSPRNSIRASSCAPCSPRLQRTDGVDAFHREAVRQMRMLTASTAPWCTASRRTARGRSSPSRRGPDWRATSGCATRPRTSRSRPVGSTSEIPSASSPTWMPRSRPCTPTLDPHGRPLDLSLAALRAVSPVHIEYLRNMGVAASMSVSILRDGSQFSERPLGQRCGMPRTWRPSSDRG